MTAQRFDLPGDDEGIPIGNRVRFYNRLLDMSDAERRALREYLAADPVPQVWRLHLIDLVERSEPDR